MACGEEPGYKPFVPFAPAMPLSSILRVAAPLALLALSGCSYFSTLDDCADVARTVNPSLEWIARLEETGRLSPATLKAAGAKYAQASGALEKKRYPSVELTTLSGDYAKLLSETAINTVLYAGALEQHDEKVRKSASHTSRQHAARQRHMIRRLQALCRGD